jgi:hypothetical protein
LSDDELKNWTQEIDGLNGALSFEERQNLFNKLAEGLDGEQLTRLVKAFDGSPGGRQALGDAVAANASPEAKVAFIKASMGSVDGKYRAMDGRDGNAETAVIADVLSSLSNDQNAFNDAITALAKHNPNGLEDIMAVALGRNYVAVPGTGGVTMFEPSAALGIINAAAKSNDPQVKALVFEAATKHFNTVEGTAVDASYTNAITHLLQSAPNALINELQSRTDISGTSLSAYAKEMLQSGNELELRNLLVQMQQGDNGTGNAYDNFSNPAHARNLGFFAGAIASGINSITDDAQAQGDLLKDIFGMGFGVAGTTNPVAGGIATVGNGITNTIINGIIDAVKNGNMELKQALFELAIPRNSEGRINMESTGYDAFVASFAAVAELQR